MSLLLIADPLPLKLDDQGTVRVGKTRVTLESVVAEFTGGATAEEIAMGFPTLNLADIYSAIAFYLRHHEEVDTYIANQYAEGEKQRKIFKAELDPQGIRDRLLARLAKKQEGHAQVPSR